MIVYKTLSGNCKRIIKKLKENSFEINGDNIFDFQEGQKFYLLIPTYEENFIVDAWDFMDIHHKDCLGIIGSGNFNFGDSMFCFTATDMGAEYNIPVVYKIENFGNKNDISQIKKIVNGGIN